MNKNEWLIQTTKEITIASFPNAGTAFPDKIRGNSTAEFMEIIYNKLKELHEKDAQ